jgi:predicted small secreted protein
MNKRLLALLSLLIIASLALAACATSANADRDTQKTTQDLSCVENPGLTYSVLSQTPVSIHCDIFQGATLTLPEATIWLLLRISDGNIQWNEGEVSIGFEELPLQCSLATSEASGKGVSMKEIDTTGTIPLGNTETVSMSCYAPGFFVNVTWSLHS